MNIQIVSQSSDQINGTQYTTFELAADKKSVIISVAKGLSNYVNVVVNNAAHQVWRGCGKDFASFDAAIQNYKCPKIKALITAAQTI